MRRGAGSLRDDGGIVMSVLDAAPKIEVVGHGNDWRVLLNGRPERQFTTLDISDDRKREAAARAFAQRLQSSFRKDSDCSPMDAALNAAEQLYERADSVAARADANPVSVLQERLKELQRNPGGNAAQIAQTKESIERARAQMSYYSRSDAAGDRINQWRIEYINSADKTANILVDAKTKEDAIAKAKRQLGKEIWRVTGAKAMGSATRVDASGNNRLREATQMLEALEGQMRKENDGNIAHLMNRVQRQRQIVRELTQAAG